MRNNLLVFSEVGDDSFGVLVFGLAQHHVTVVTIDLGREATVSGLFDQVAFPKVGHRTVLDRCGPPACGDGVLDLAEPILIRTGIP